MKSFAYMKSEEFDSDLCCQILDVIKGLKHYFVKFNGSMAEVAMQQSLFHALYHYCSSDGDLVPYLKTLARTILLSDMKDKPCDCIEAVVSDVTEDTANAIIEGMYEKEFLNKLSNLSLSYMHYFLLLCNSFLEKDSDSRYFPKEFKSECIKLSKMNNAFAGVCLDIYKKSGTEMKEFLSLEADKVGEWKETEYSIIDSYTSKRVRFVNTDGTPLTVRGGSHVDIDSVDWRLAGSIAEKRVVKIKFSHVWDTMCDFVESDEINPMKFKVNDSFITRTLGGSWSVPNPAVGHIFDLCLDEIKTNLIYATLGRYLGQGVDYMYFLVDKVTPIEPRRAMGVDLNFEVIDITDEAVSRQYVKR